MPFWTCKLRNKTLKVLQMLKNSLQVPDLAALSLVLEGPSTSLLFVPDLRKTVVLTCFSAKLTASTMISLVAKWCGFASYSLCMVCWLLYTELKQLLYNA